MSTRSVASPTACILGLVLLCGGCGASDDGNLGPDAAAGGMGGTTSNMPDGAVAGTGGVSANGGNGGAPAQGGAGGTAGGAGSGPMGGSGGVGGTAGTGGVTGTGGVVGTGGMGGAPSACTFDFSKLDAELAATVQRNDVPGLAFSVVKRNCGVVYEKAFGTYSTTKVVELASASKMPSMTLVMAMVDKGLIKLDEPVKTYLPGWPANKAAITVRQLMSHTSALAANPQCLSQKDSSLAECAAAIGMLPLAGESGKDFIYGGGSFQVAGRIVEVVSGKSWNQAFSDTIANPCRLESFSYDVSANNALGSATNPRVAGGAAAHVKDYGKLLQLHLNGGLCGAERVLSLGAVVEMMKNQTKDAVKKESPYTDGRDYGFGWWHEQSGGGQTAIWSDAGAFGTKPWIEPNKGYAAVVLIQKGLKFGEQIYDATLPLVQAALSAK